MVNMIYELHDLPKNGKEGANHTWHTFQWKAISQLLRDSWHVLHIGTIDNSTNPVNVLSPDQGTYLNHTMTNSTSLKGMNFSNKEK